MEYTIRVERIERNSNIEISDTSVGITITVLRTGLAAVDELVDIAWLEPVDGNGNEQ